MSRRCRTFEHFFCNSVRRHSLVRTLDLFRHIWFEALLVLEAGGVDRRGEEQVHRDAVELEFVPECFGETCARRRSRSVSDCLLSRFRKSADKTQRPTSNGVFARRVGRVARKAHEREDRTRQNDPAALLALLLHGAHRLMDRVQTSPEIPLHAFPMFRGGHVGEEARDAAAGAGKDVVGRGRRVRSAGRVQGRGGGGGVGQVACVRLKDLSWRLAMSLREIRRPRQRGGVKKPPSRVGVNGTDLDFG